MISVNHMIKIYFIYLKNKEFNNKNYIFLLILNLIYHF